MLQCSKSTFSTHIGIRQSHFNTKILFWNYHISHGVYYIWRHFRNDQSNSLCSVTSRFDSFLILFSTAHVKRTHPCMKLILKRVVAYSRRKIAVSELNFTHILLGLAVRMSILLKETRRLIGGFSQAIVIFFYCASFSNKIMLLSHTP